VVADELRSSAAHVLVAGLDGESASVDDDDARHLSRVLRLRDGESVTLTDGDDRWRRGHWRGDGRVAFDGPVETVIRREPRLTVGFAPVKGDRPEWTVQKLTELGIDRVLVLRAERSVVTWEGPRLAKQLERLRRVAKEALMQARLCRLPEIDAPPALPPGALAHFDGAPLAGHHHTILIGPEGGWTERELDERELVSLGATVLRAETASIAAAVRMSALREGS
jgi:16S rRNA (uracil1498-N3)-methyltransferase